MNQFHVSEDETNFPQMRYIEHFKELRRRLVYAVASILLIFFLLLPFTQQIYHILAQPLINILPLHSSMIATDVMGTFLAPLKLSIYLAFLIAMPIVIYQIWQFIAPALYKNEKNIIFLLIISSVFLFILGIAFSYFLILPMALKFFMYASPENVLPMTDISSYLNFCIKIFFAFGLAFQIPIVTFILLLSRILNVEQLIYYRRHIIVFFFFISMFITPPDIFSMLALAIPMSLLFEIALQAGKLKFKNVA